MATPSPAPTPSGVPLDTRNMPESKRATVPPVGPPWFGALMGTSILATLSVLRTDVVSFGIGLGQCFWCLALVVFTGLVGGFLARVMRHPRTLMESFAKPVAAAQWGMVAMGFLSFGSATAAVLPSFHEPWAHTAWNIDLGFFVIGSLLGGVTTVAVPLKLIRNEPGTPTTVWGLAVVPPMVSATVGAGLIPHLATTSGKMMMLVVVIGCFFTALTLGIMLFALAYFHLWRRETLPIEASLSAWLPLGILGQSTAAVMTITASIKPMVTPPVASTLHSLTSIYGYVMLSLGTPLALWALVMTMRGFRAHMVFNPGWWGMTFPVGTLVLGATLLGRSSSHSFITDAGATLYVFLLGTWTTCAIASVCAVMTPRLSRHSDRQTQVS